jgi:hypothetical protein
MRALVDLVDSVTSVFNRSVWMLVIGGIVAAAIIALVIGFTTPTMVHEVGERAERISEKAIEAERRERRERALAEEGWGYSDTASDYSATDAADESADGFGADAE